VETALRASGLPASRLALDLSERTAMSRSDEVKERLQRLRGLGVALALDDFGTGFFSIAVIRELGFGCLKIDRSLVAGLPDHVDHAAQVKSILDLARSLGIEAVAEGVETRAEHDFLEKRGCAGFQGFLVSPPLEPEEARAFIQKELGS
jgi:EAL domain-containing protein (putative c-di-GMP-specific phosphodiesterase class I)